MTLTPEKYAFRTGYYLVGTGMIRMPAHGITSCQVTNWRTQACALPSERAGDAETRLRFSHGLPKLMGNLRQLVLLHHNASK
ncbi:MAG: hypothetical protein OK455_06125 [Thaumarchaeota archaeon]|nr:hypothetical protein [Nitrososphaerota archaeon]